jgi:hypothetical protein
MLDPELDVPRTETFAQTFSIRYDYPVSFTRDLFDPRNPCLRQVLMPSPSARPQRLAVFIDESVTLAWPQLAGRIVDYGAAHAAAMELVVDIVVIPGGEAAKNQHDCVEALLKDWRVMSIGSPTRSPSVAAPCSMRWDLPPRYSIAVRATSGALPRCSRKAIPASV